MERRTFVQGSAALTLLMGATGMAKWSSATATDSLGPMLDDWTGAHGGYPPFDKVTVDGMKPAILKGMDLQRAEVNAIANSTAPATFENTLAALEDAGRPLKRVTGLFNIWISTLDDKAMQKVEAEMNPVFAAFGDELVQNEALFRRIKSVYDARASAGLTAEQQRLTDVQYTFFVRQGAALKASDKERLRAINQQLAKAFTAFSQNQLHDEETYTIELTSEADLAGLPDSLKSAARSAAAAHGKPAAWLIANTRSSAEPFLTYATRRDLREKVYRMWTRRGEMDDAHNNKPVIATILKLRAERARLLGYPTHAHWILDDNMARTPDNAMNLMMKVWRAAVGRVHEDVAAMQKIADHEGATFKLEAWDYRFYAEKLRKQQYDLDNNDVTQYLQLDKIREGMFWAAGQVYGLSFARIEGLPVAQADITVYEVSRDGKRVGLWYFDPYSRDGKLSGAWMNEYRTQERFHGDITPIVSNNANFVRTKPGEPTLISWDDAVTMFHEFGHALHGLQSNATYPTLAGTAVKRDFVEFPSQVNERWLPTKEVLSRFALHHQTGQAMPAALAEKIRKAHTFNQGFLTVEYMAAAIYDMKVHLAATADKDIDAVDFEHTTMAEIGMPKEIVMRHRPPAFGHIFSGDAYSAGYYVYIWADTMSADAVEAFVEAGSMYDRNTCDRFRDTIYSVGNTVAPDVAFRNFRGRDVDTRALMRDRGFPVT
jgi:peptidyl-dipeptidase Dcp